MSVIEKLKQELSECSNVICEEQDGTIIIRTRDPNGFDIQIFKNAEEYLVFFGSGYHDHFESEDDVAKFVNYGLSGDCRIREIRRGKIAYKWILESNVDGTWQPYQTVGSILAILVPFWKRKKILIYRNNIHTTC
jgi:hypothetical protein